VKGASVGKVAQFLTLGQVLVVSPLLLVGNVGVAVQGQGRSGLIVPGDDGSDDGRLWRLVELMAHVNGDIARRLWISRAGALATKTEPWSVPHSRQAYSLSMRKSAISGGSSSGHSHGWSRSGILAAGVDYNIPRHAYSAIKDDAVG
jgi:hypothetical protein